MCTPMATTWEQCRRVLGRAPSSRTLASAMVSEGSMAQSTTPLWSFIVWSFVMGRTRTLTPMVEDPASGAEKARCGSGGGEGHIRLLPLLSLLSEPGLDSGVRTLFCNPAPFPHPRCLASGPRASVDLRCLAIRKPR